MKSTKNLDPRRKLFTKNNAYVFVSTIFFIGCTAFVVCHGYRCFDKYLKKPEHTEISYKSSKSYSFPSFTLCTSYKQSYNVDQMKNVNLKKMNIQKGANGQELVALIPKFYIIKLQLLVKISGLRVFKFILTYALSDNYYWIQPGNLEWKLALSCPYQRCFTFSIPDDIVGEGIEKVGVVSIFGKVQIGDSLEPRYCF